MKKIITILPILWVLTACTPDTKSAENSNSSNSTKTVETAVDTSANVAEKTTSEVAAKTETTPSKEVSPTKEKSENKPPKVSENTPPKAEEGGGKRAASLFDRFHTSQILVVKAANEKAIQGTLCLYEWDATKKVWNPKSGNLSVTLGRTGMAWAKGLQPQPWNVGTLKKEGDGKAPEGIFEISSLFGYKEKAKLSFSPKMPYTHSKSSFVCVDDVNSSHYNQILDSEGVTSDWKSKEDMLRKDNLYELGAVVAYNTQNVAKGEGSCVFLHIWRGADKPTAGCTAMTEANAKSIFSQLDASKKPLLIQLTEENYGKYKNVLQFP